jgi:hypothetical protein
MEKMELVDLVKIVFNLGKLSKIHEERYIKVKRQIIRVLQHISDNIPKLQQDDIGELLRFFTHNRSINPILLHKITALCYENIRDNPDSLDLKTIIRFLNCMSS